MESNFSTINSLSIIKNCDNNWKDNGFPNQINISLKDENLSEIDFSLFIKQLGIPLMKEDDIVVVYFDLSLEGLTTTLINSIGNALKDSFPNNKFVFVPKDYINIEIENKDKLINKLKDIIKKLES